MRINHNISALSTNNVLAKNNAATGSSLSKLSTGLRINSAADDAAGLAISEKMRAQISGLDQAESNANDGISLIQTAEGALSETHSILQRMRELAVQSANDTNTDDDRAEIQLEIDQLSEEITRISTDTEFNTKNLLDGSMGKTYATTANTFTASLQDVQITGSDITTGTYTITATAAGTDTATVSTNTAASGFVFTDLTVDNGTKFGDYSLQVSNINVGGGTADFTLTGPDGSTETISGGSITAAALDFTTTGIAFDFSTHDVDANGTIAFSLTNAGLDVDLSGAKTVNTAAIASYAGETINLGGFSFEATWGAGAGALTMNVTDNAMNFQIGANSGQNTTLSINNMSATALGVNSLDLTTQTAADAAIDTIDAAIKSVSTQRAQLGAAQNRLEHTINNLSTSSENLTAAESQIRDVDMAEEMTEYTKNNILSQAAQAMLAQANQQPQNVLQLLQ